MDDELAKQLRNSGFVHFWGTYWLPDTPPKFKKNWLPNLSDLVFGCGKDFGELTRSSGDSVFTWKAVDRNNENGQLGNTPEEAVALLYLAIHTPPVTDSKDMID